MIDNIVFDTSEEEKDDFHIMIVDDQTSCIKIIKDSLCLKGYKHFYLYSNPHRALEHIRTVFHPSLIIVDFQMPQMNGITFINKVNGCTENIPIILVSGNPYLITQSRIPSCSILDKGDIAFTRQLLKAVDHIREQETICLFDRQSVQTSTRQNRSFLVMQ